MMVSMMVVIWDQRGMGGSLGEADQVRQTR